MKVNPDELRAMAVALDMAGQTIDDLDVRTICSSAGSSLAGTSLSQACSQAGEYVEGAYLRMAGRMWRMSGVAKGTADSYDVTDEDFTHKLDEMGHQG